jgi:hypothetical protein
VAAASIESNLTTLRTETEKPAQLQAAELNLLQNASI